MANLPSKQLGPRRPTVSKQKISESGLLSSEMHRVNYENGKLVATPYLSVNMLEGAKDFPEDLFGQLANLTNQIFRVLELVGAGDEAARTHLAAIHKRAFADVLGVSENNLKEIWVWQGGLDPFGIFIWPHPLT